MSEAASRPILKFLVIITDHHRAKKVAELTRRHHLYLHYQMRGEGTASSEILDWLGLGRTDKIVSICLAPSHIIRELMRDVSMDLQLVVPGNGIAFTVPLSGVSNPVLKMLLDEKTRELLKSQLESEVEKMKNDAAYDLIMAVINQGYSEELMKAARSGGATGGTVLHARGMGQEEMKVWGISVQAEKELVMILAKKENTMTIMKAIGRQCGFSTDARGLIFSLPVSGVAGLDMTPLLM